MGNCIRHNGNATVLSAAVHIPRGRLGSSEATYRSFEYLSPVTSSETIHVEVEETTTTVSRTEKKRTSKFCFKRSGNGAGKGKRGKKAGKCTDNLDPDALVPEILVTSPGGGCRKATSVGRADVNQNVSYFVSYTQVDIPEVPLGSYLLRQFDLHGDQVAVIDSQSDESYRYRDMAQLTRRISSALWKRGFRQGNTLCIISSNSIEIAPVLCAVLCSGGICAILQPDLPIVTLSRQIREVRPMVLITEACLADPCLRATATAGILTEIYTIGKEDGFHPLSELQNDNGSCFPTGLKVTPKKTCSLILFSSDSFSSPKPIPLSHFSVLSNILQVQTTLSVKRGSSMGCFLSLTDHFGLIGSLLCGLLAGAKVILVKTPTMEHCITAIIKYKPQRIHISSELASTMFMNEMMTLCDLTNLEYLLCGTAHLPAETQSSIAQKLENTRVFQAYGNNSTLITHCGCILSVPPSGSSGCLVPNTACKILDRGTRRPLYTDETGEIWVNGPQCMMGYGTSTSGSFCHVDEWMFTGDIGHVDDKGNLFVEFTKPTDGCWI